MTRIYRIPTSQVDGNGSNDNDTSEIRPYGEIAFYIGDNNKLELLIFDGVRTHVNSKVLNKGTFYGGDADSGDGSGFDTIKLVPDENLRRNGSDQYIIVDPTAPNHIHLRAGGTIDNSTADLFIGGEDNHIKISDSYETVTVRTGQVGANYDWVFDNIGRLTLPSGLSIDRIGNYAPAPGTIITQTGDEPLMIATTGSSAITQLGWAENTFVPGKVSFMTFSEAGVNLTVGSYTGTVYNFAFNNSGTFVLGNSTSTIKTEVFDNQGNPFESIVLTPDPTFDQGQGLRIYSGFAEQGHLHLTASTSTTDLFFGNDNQYVKLASDGHIEISPQAGLRLWGQGIFSNAYVYLPSQEESTTTSLLVANYGDAGVLIQTGNGSPPNNWQFGSDGSLTFPSGGNITFDNSATSNIYGLTGIEFADGTTQTTAFVIGTAPLSSTSTGSAGTIAYDASYFYVCTATNSWQRISWDSTPW